MRFGDMLMVAAAQGGTPPWTPAQASSPVAWLDASVPASLTRDGSDGVLSWAQQAGAAAPAAQADAGKRPIYSATGFDGSRPGLTADGVDDYLGMAAFAALTDFTFVAVINAWNTAGVLARDDADGRAQVIKIGDNIWGYAGGPSGASIGTNYPAGGKAVVVVLNDATETIIRINGVAATPAPTPDLTLGFTGQALNLFAGGGGGSPSGVKLAELFISSVKADTATAQRFEAYASAKWGI